MCMCLETDIPTFPTHFSFWSLCLESFIAQVSPSSTALVLCLTLREYDEHKRACVGSYIAQGRRWTLPVCLAVSLFVWLSDLSSPQPHTWVIMCWFKLSLILKNIVSTNLMKIFMFGLHRHNLREFKQIWEINVKSIELLTRKLLHIGCSGVLMIWHGCDVVIWWCGGDLSEMVS